MPFWNRTVFEEINNARAHAIVHEAVERLLAPKGFEAAGDLKWVKDRHAPIRHIFAFTKWKGGVIAPRWGVSLDFVPHISGNRVVWHRSNKNAMPDLCVDSGDRTVEMSYIQGEAPIRQKHASVLATTIDRAEDFWARCEAIAELPLAIEWLKSNMSRGGLGFYIYTQHPLTVAFVHAKMGRFDQALTELETHVFNKDTRSDVRQRLTGLILSEKA